MEQLPYFKFNAAEYLLGSITRCTLSAQGLFANLCSLYWHRGGELPLADAMELIEGSSKADIDELSARKCLSVEGGKVHISFLARQLSENGKRHSLNVDNGRKGGLARASKEAKLKPASSQPQAKSKATDIARLKGGQNVAQALRTDKIRTEQRSNTTEGSSITSGVLLAGFGFPNEVNVRALWALLTSKVGLEAEKDLSDRCMGWISKIAALPKPSTDAALANLDALLDSPATVHLFSAELVEETIRLEHDCIVAELKRESAQNPVKP